MPVVVQLAGGHLEDLEHPRVVAWRRRRGPASRRPCRRCWGRCHRRRRACGPVRAPSAAPSCRRRTRAARPPGPRGTPRSTTLLPAVAEPAVEALLDRRDALRSIVRRDGHALARRKTVRLHDDRSDRRLEVRERGLAIGERLGARGGNLRSLHQVLRERLAALERGAVAARPDRGDCRRRAGASASPSHSGPSGPITARSMRFSRANATTAESSARSSATLVVSALTRSPAVAGRREDRLDERRLGERMHDRVLATAGTNDENAHATPPSLESEERHVTLIGPGTRFAPEPSSSQLVRYAASR